MIAMHPLSILPHLMAVGITPDMPLTLAVAVFGSILVLMLPVRYAILPLAILMCAYPSELLVPPPELQFTAQRVIAAALILRCIITPSIRQKFRWGWVDTAAMLFFLLELLAQLMTATDLGAAVNNRAGFFLSAFVPFWCVRMLVIDRERFYLFMKGLLWASVPLAILGVVQMTTGFNPYDAIMQFGSHWIEINKLEVMQRPLLGTPMWRATGPFMQCIMYGWFFAMQITLATSLYFEKKRLTPWCLAWLLLPVGAISTISAGPMTMAAITVFLACLFPYRKYWKAALGGALGVFLLLNALSNRTPLQFVAGLGFDASSSWYRVSLCNYTTTGPGMVGHWLFGYGMIPPVYDIWHDLCIEWVSLAVYYGLAGVIGFHLLVLAVAGQLWAAKRKAQSIADQWMLWTMMAVLVGSMLALQLVSLFAEMYHLYFMFLALIGNCARIVGQEQLRYVGVMAERNGQPVVLRYALKPGQRLAVITPPETNNAVPNYTAEKPRSATVR